MKMVKKILLGLVATATILALSGCKIPGTDDDRGVIKGSNNNYSIDYTNETDGYRAYKPTTLKHAGALVKVTFDEPEDNNWSKMGVIFDLSEKDNVRQFYIIGLAGAKNSNCYVSQFTNVTDIQADNFGTKLDTNPAKETVIFDKSNTQNGIGSVKRPTADEDGSVSYYVYYKEFKNTGTTPTKGYFEWGVFGFNETQAEVAKKAVKKSDCTLATLNAIDTNLAGGTIPDAFDLTTTGALPQNNIAVYAKIDEGKSLKGTWTYLDTYKEAEEIEE